MKIVCNHYFFVLKLFSVLKGFILYQIKQTALILGYNFTTYGAVSRTPAELKNCKLENPSPLFRSLAQYIESDKRRVFEPLSHNCSMLCHYNFCSLYFIVKV